MMKRMTSKQDKGHGRPRLSHDTFFRDPIATTVADEQLIYY